MMIKVSGHVFWYADEKPDSFAQALIGVLVERQPASWTVINQIGIEKIRTSAKQSNQSEALNRAWQHGFISLAARATLVGGKVSVLYEPSVLSVQYDPFPEGVTYPPSAAQDERSAYRSLHSAYSYVKRRGLVQYPHLLLWEYTNAGQQLESREQTQRLANAILAIPTGKDFRWLAALDASPELLLDVVPFGLRGNAEPLTDRLDKYMGMPSYLTIGSRATIVQYRDSIAAEFPEETFEYREEGNSAYLVFDDMVSTKRIYMPAWHKRHR